MTRRREDGGIPSSLFFTMKLYYLDGEKIKPVESVHQWMARRSGSNWIIADDTVGATRIVTGFVGFDAREDPMLKPEYKAIVDTFNAPVLWRSLIFNGSPTPRAVFTTGNLEQAEAMHQQMMLEALG
jgi:hypothetical protein